MTPKKQKALLALLTNPTKEKAASAAGITPKTLRSYLADPVFQAEYKRAFSELVEDATRQAQQATIRNELKYARDQYGTVYISGGSIRSLNDDGSYNPTIGSGVIFAQLPAGFRPGIYRRYPAIAEATGSIVPADVDIGESGYMQVHISGSQARYAIIALPTIMFPAGN